MWEVLLLRKRVTSSDVAKRAGVSRSLVSAFLNGTPGISVSENNRAAITNAINELNYTVNVQAKSIKTGRSQCIAVYGDVYNALLLQLVEGIQKASGPAGYHVLMYGETGSLEGREGLIALYRQGRIDGMITLDFPDRLDEDWERAVLQSGVPYVSVEGIPASPAIHTVQTGYDASIKDALDFIWNRTGQAPIYLNMLPADRQPSHGDCRRLGAYIGWMEERGLVPETVQVIDEPWVRQKQWWKEWLAGRERPLAVLANWSRAAVNVYRAAYEQGWQIGQELFVMSADDTERVSRHMVPPVPCIEVPYQDMGQEAFQMLMKLMDSEALGNEPGLSEEVGRILVSGRLYDGLD